MGHLYSQLKVFHFREKLDSLPLEHPEIKPPIHIRIKPTNVCGHHCWYCAYKADNLQLGKDMVTKDSIPREKMLEIIDDCSEMGVQAITFSGGGDPFYYKHLTEAVKKLSETKIHFASLTNGAKLDGELAELFSRYGTWLRISIDGYDDESYSKYRGVKYGEFSMVMKNLENFQKLKGKCYLGISLIIDKDNYHKMYDFAKMVKDIGVHSIKISPCVTSNDGAENDAYHAPFFNKAKELAQKTNADLEDANFEVFDSYHVLDEKFEKDYDWCPFSQILPVIGADCGIYPCHDKAYNNEALLGSIKDIGFKDWWTSDKNNFFKIDPSKMCNNHCVANGKNKMILDYLSQDIEHLGFV